jgi:hypothetical protein
MSAKCKSKTCENPRNGHLTDDDYALMSDIKKDGTQSRATTCRLCKSKYVAAWRAGHINRLARAENRHLTDWSEFTKCAWDVKAANSVIRGMM